MSRKVIVTSVVGLVIIVIGIVLHIVCTATTRWAQGPIIGDYIYIGMWRYCLKNADICDDIPGASDLSNLKAAKAFAILGLVSAVIAGGLLLLNLLIVILKRSNNRIISFLSFIFSNLAFTSIEICAAIWGTQINYDFSLFGIMNLPDLYLGYSFYMSASQGFVIAIGGLIGYLGSWQQEQAIISKPF